MSEWTSLREIMQDLSVAQGYMVPASLETFGNSRPPIKTINEECEEQSLYACGGGGDFETPDYSLIQQMLNVVREKEVNSENNNSEITSELDPYSPEFVPQVVQKKIKRNIALSSIIKAKESEMAAIHPITKAVIPTMFKRKSFNGTDCNRKTETSSQTSSPKKYDQYTPTTFATEYYSKYVEKSKLREKLEEDIWSRAEWQMKELDTRKQREEKCASATELGFLTVSLPQDRHRLTGKCVVCEVASKHGYKFKGAL